jgi:hypothetical protein
VAALFRGEAVSQQIKAAVRLRDGMRCTECGLTDRQHRRRFGRTLDVHRVTPGASYTVDGCTTLCRPCHSSKPKLPHGTRPPFRRRSGEVFPIGVKINPDLAAALEAFMKTSRRTKRAAVEMALEEYLRARDLWPPKAFP